MMMTTMQQQHHNRKNVMKKMILKKSTIRLLPLLSLRKSMMMIIMILLLSSYSLLTTTLAQIIDDGSNDPTATALIQMKNRNFSPYALIFLHANSSSGNSTHINITDANMIDDSDLCYNEFEFIRNMLYTTYTSALLVETPLTTETLYKLDDELSTSKLFTSVADVVDGKSDQNIIIVHQESLPLTLASSPLDEKEISLSPSSPSSPSSSPTYRPSFKPSSSLRPSILPTLAPNDNVLSLSPPSPVPSNIPTTSEPPLAEAEERIIDDGIIVTTTDDEDTFSAIVGDDICATLIIEVVVPTPTLKVTSPSGRPSSKPSGSRSSKPSGKPSSKPSVSPSSKPSGRPITAPVPAPLPIGPNTFTGTFTLVRAGMSGTSNAASIFLGNYSSGATIDISSFSNQSLSLSVDFRCCFTSLVFNYTSSTPSANFIRPELTAPYALNGNYDSNYNVVLDLSISGPKRISVAGYNGSNNIIANLALDFVIVGGRPPLNPAPTVSRRISSSPLSPSTAPSPATPSSVTTAPIAPAPVKPLPVKVTINSNDQCTRRRLLEKEKEKEKEEVVFKHDDDDVHNLEHEGVDDVHDYDNESLPTLQTMSNEQQRRLQRMCRVSTCNLSKFVIHIAGCRGYCISIQYRRKERNLLRREQHEQQQHEHQQNHVERKSSQNSSKSNTFYNVIYRKGNIDAITRGRGDGAAAIFYKYVKQYIPNEHVCQSILSSMTYIIIDLDIE